MHHAASHTHILVLTPAPMNPSHRLRKMPASSAAPNGSYPASVQAALDLVASKIAAAVSHIDASHDLQHILRVVGMTGRLAKASEQSFDAERTETALLAAALHDVGDAKYAGSEAEGRAALRAVLDELVAGGHISAARAERWVGLCQRFRLVLRGMVD